MSACAKIMPPVPADDPGCRKQGIRILALRSQAGLWGRRFVFRIADIKIAIILNIEWVDSANDPFKFFNNRDLIEIYAFHRLPPGVPQEGGIFTH
jgi:hypothetical protein